MNTESGHETQQRSVIQRVSDATGGIITPANLLDTKAMHMAWEGSRDLETWNGIGKTALAYLIDAGDGALANWTGTRTQAGKFFDHIGDKVKLGFTIPRIWRSDLAPKSLLTAVAVQNAANAGISIYDRTVNDEPQITEATTGRRVIAASCGGIGLNVIGHKVQETRPKLGRTIRFAGSIMGWSGVAFGFAKTTPDYFKQAVRRPSENTTT